MKWLWKLMIGTIFLIALGNIIIWFTIPYHLIEYGLYAIVFNMIVVLLYFIILFIIDRKKYPKVRGQNEN